MTLESTTQQIYAQARRAMRISARRIANRVRLEPLDAATKLDELLQRIGQRILIPTLRKRYAELGERIQNELEQWQSTYARTEAHLPADIGYYHTQHLQGIWQRYSQTLTKFIVQRILIGIQQGEETDDTMRSIQQLLTERLAGYALERIIRTETTRYYNWAVYWETATYPEVAGYRYAVVQDDRTSAICNSVAGKIVRKSELKLIPPLHPNCRTILVPLRQQDMQGQQLSLEQVHPRAFAFGILPRFLQQRAMQALDITPTSRFWALWHIHEAAIRNYCITLTPNHYEDLLHDTMVRAYERFSLYDPSRSRYTTWICQIAYNLYLNQKSKYQREILFSDLKYIPDIPDMSDS